MSALCSVLQYPRAVQKIDLEFGPFQSFPIWFNPSDPLAFLLFLATASNISLEIV